MLSLPGTRMKRILAFTFFLLFLAAFAFTSLDGIKRKADQQQGSSAEQPTLDLAGTNWRLADTGGTEIETVKVDQKSWHDLKIDLKDRATEDEVFLQLIAPADRQYQGGIWIDYLDFFDS